MDQHRHQHLLRRFLPKVDKCAAAGDEKGIAKVMYTGWILYAAMFALAAFLSTYALQSGISAFVAAFPACLSTALKLPVV